MSIDLSKVTALSDDYGNIAQLELGGKVIWAVSGGKVILQVEKITSDTYAAETTYTGEQFILLDIYPKTNGTVTVTYGGLTKTITDTSGAAEPNAQQVVFGTFNGVTHDTTPASGEMTIEGEYATFGCGVYQLNKLYKFIYTGITAIKSFGLLSYIPHHGFGGINSLVPSGCKFSKITIPNSITKIGDYAFAGCINLTSINIHQNIVELGINPFAIPYYNLATGNKCDFTIDNINLSANNNYYKKLNNCIVETATGRVVLGSGDLPIPTTAKSIDAYAFYYRSNILKNLEIPDGVTSIGECAFYSCNCESIRIPASVTNIDSNAFAINYSASVIFEATTPPSFGTLVFGTPSSFTGTITVPKGCGDAYKTAINFDDYADFIVEAS